ncbi:MAG: NusG domain II-containing protein [Candidatus Nitrotoga sp.]|nr:NusG domain II-containing protein [Candidatus Nitrotoga sp.]MDO9447344.1 NusG domain II-containing protein [Candidatus Nitrotoga sp.]MDP3496873.1 NusG domain II-containing protein [Candidatus Nitrotoga sp.]
MLSLAPIKIGDWIVLLLGMLGITWITITLWQGGAADKAIIRSSGKIFSEVPLSRNQIISVPGPLGISQIAIHNRQARIAADPSPRQYCVHQGWLKQAGEIAICLPNQVSVELSGRGKRYDSLNY